MTIAEKFVSSKVLYQNYDFDARKLRRSGYLNKEIASENLLLMKKVLDSFGIRFTLLFGTLLGAVREGGFINHDTDTDIGIYEKDRQILMEAIPVLLDNGFDIIRTKYPDDLVTFMRKDEYIDVGIFRVIKKRLKIYYAYQDHLIGAEYLEQLDEIVFLGEKFNTPSNPKWYLSKTYGSGWMVSRPNEPALNTGPFNLYFRVKRWFLRTKLGNIVRSVLRRSN